jgi:shikimate dehydrogenase
VRVSASTKVAGVVGNPIVHSLSPAIHGAWIEAAGLDAAYFAAEPERGAFRQFVRTPGLAAGFGQADFRGLNVTAPFKSEALAIADLASRRAQRAGAANLLIFESGGRILADNTDGEGLLAAFCEQAVGFDPAAGPVVILGGGGAARGAVAAFLDAGAPGVRLANRSLDRAAALAAEFGESVSVIEPGALAAALADANAIINARPAAPDIPLERAAASAVVMDMVYRPLVTPFLARAQAAGLKTVDGLAMLIGQARPSFAAFFGQGPPDVDVRAKAINFLAHEASA